MVKTPPHRIEFKKTPFTQPDIHKNQYQVAAGNIAINIVLPLIKNRDSVRKPHQYLTSSIKNNDMRDTPTPEMITPYKKIIFINTTEPQ